MKITLDTSGGFAYLPALNKSITLDTAQIDPKLRNELESLVMESGFFEQPERAADPPPGAADYFTYRLTVRDAGRAHTIEFTDLTQSPKLLELASSLQKVVRESIR